MELGCCVAYGVDGSNHYIEGVAARSDCQQLVCRVVSMCFDCDVGGKRCVSVKMVEAFSVLV